MGAKRGRKPKVSASDKLEAINSNTLNILNENSLRGKTDNVWKKLSEVLQNKVEPESLYIDFYQNRNNLFTDYLDLIGKTGVIPVKGILVPQTEKIVEKSTVTPYDEALDFHDDSDIDEGSKKRANNKTLFFELDIGEENWCKMKPVAGTTSFRPGWTDRLFKMIWNEQKSWSTRKLQCCFNFKRCTIRKEKGPSMSFDAYCYERKNTLRGESDNDPQDSLVKFNIVTRESTMTHSSCRQLKGENLSDMIARLEGKTPRLVRTQIINEEVKCGQPMAPHVPSLKTLSKAKSKGRKITLGLIPETTVWQSFTNIKANVEFAPFIRNIGFNKGFIEYWSQDQVNLHNDMQKFTKNVVSMDSSGSVFRKVNGTLEMFLTVIVTHVGNNTVPVFQVASELNDSNFLAWALNNWKKSGAMTPGELVTDRGKGLQNGACLSFNLCSYEEFIDICWTSIDTGDRKVLSSLKCQMRIDIAHLMHSVSKFDCFQNCKSRVKEFFLRAIGLLTKSKTREDFIKIYNKILIVANSTIEGEECLSARNSVKAAIRNHDFGDKMWNGVCTKEKSIGVIDVEAEKIEKEEFLNLENQYKNDQIKKKENTNPLPKRKPFKRPIQEYLYLQKEQIFADIQEREDDIMKSGDESYKENDFALPSLTLPFMKSCLEFPAWSNVMNTSFGSPNDVASSARVEGYFSYTKPAIKEGAHRVSADVAVCRHIRNISAEAAECRSLIDKAIAGKPQLRRKEDNRVLAEQETWGGVIEFAKIKMLRKRFKIPVELTMKVIRNSKMHGLSEKVWNRHITTKRQEILIQVFIHEIMLLYYMHGRICLLF